MAESSASLAQPRVAVRRAVDWITPALVLIFIFSGASGLIYQVSWVRLLSFTFGVTIYAISTVVAAFMGGLALGSFLGGRVADRVQRPILWYAVVELIVAAMGLLSPLVLAWVQSAYVALYPRDSGEISLGLVVLRFALAAVVLLIPTTMMGATLPLMVKGSLSMGRNIGSRISWLYASNTTGAIIGTVVAGFYMIGVMGIAETIRAAAILNLIAAFSALALGLAVRPVTAQGLAIEEEAVADQPVPSAMEGVPSYAGKLVIITFAVQGFASLAYEIIWTRILAIILDGSTYAFSLVLGVVLLGIALGSALVGPFMGRNWPWLRLYALLQAGVAALAFIGLAFFAHAFGVMDRLQNFPVLRPLLEWHYGRMALIALFGVLPPMLLLGASFPIAAKIVVSGARNAGRDLGALYAGNTGGAILGACLAGFFLIPALGTQTSIQLLAVVNAVLAVVLAAVSGRGRWVTVGISVAMILAALVIAVRFAPNMYERVVAGRFQGYDPLWIGEGKETSVAIVRARDTGISHMFINGQGQASDDPGMVWFHRDFGYLPMALNRDPQDILIVGLGGGATAGALAQFNPQRMDVVELSDTVVEGAKRFSYVNDDVLNFPNLHLKIDDGRNHLLLSNRKYDVVTADVIHPRNAGAALLYSYEYYDLVAKSLKPGGMMSQWLEDNGDNPDNEVQRRLMVRTFAKAFPYVSLWAFGSLLIGSNEPIDFSQATLASRWGPWNLDQVLAGSGFDSIEAIRGLHNMNDAEVRAWAGDGPIMSDDHPYAEYFLSLPGGTQSLR